MSAPRPYETDPFHPPSSVRVVYSDQFLYIYKTVPHISSVWYLHCVMKHRTFVIYACALSEVLISRSSAILKSFCITTGTNWYEIQRDTNSTMRDAQSLHYKYPGEPHIISHSKSIRN